MKIRYVNLGNRRRPRRYTQTHTDAHNARSRTHTHAATHKRIQRLPHLNPTLICGVTRIRAGPGPQKPSPNLTYPYPCPRPTSPFPGRNGTAASERKISKAPEQKQDDQRPLLPNSSEIGNSMVKYKTISLDFTRQNGKLKWQWPINEQNNLKTEF